ncbi:MAG: tRNA uridine(34) 5-carboxymethylaminomethyl modification radical SAM/GNAT enzyme Elp3 [Candidatus Heimdallarchaeaceae archaeon]
MNKSLSAFTEIKIQLLSQSKLTEKTIDQIKRRVAKEYSLPFFPRNSDILAICNDEELEELRPYLIKRRVRTLSGVAIVAVMTRPWACPHGKCIMCPGGPDVDRPQSYTGYEPTSRRGIRNNYDPYLQVTERINQLEAIGHYTEKIDAIIMGGTFTYQPKEYQEWFVRRMFDGFNGVDSDTIEQAHEINEHAKHRCVGLTAETRPDQIEKQTIDELLNYGVTRLELGIQTVYDDVFEKMIRGHTDADSIKAIQLTKDAGLKITAHMMPGLPGSTKERDIEAFKTIFQSQDYQPDEIKIYPTMVIPGTKLYDLWKKGEYQALTDEETIELIAKIKEFVPPYVRIKRILRDIPAHQIAAGPKKSDLRLDIQAFLKSQGKKCRCIRCREVGHYLYKDKGEFDPQSIELVKRRYQASKGIEHFLSFEEVKHDVIIGFLRLRELSEDNYRPEFLSHPTIIIRELHVYGESLSVHKKGEEEYEWQHRGFGKELVQIAEEIGVERGYKKISVISGVGVRDYYRKLGYKRDGPYMSKTL